ncbi:MAG: DUF5058 family protein, partial [Firmicutes bacterium]|nr:DUF5058 family protein [Bacillota bacterium]
MGILSKLNSPVMYLICGSVVLFVAFLCIIFAVRAYRAGVAIGMDPSRMKTAIISSVSFAALPSVAILLGVIALSGSLGTPWPWLRLSVVGALHYETQVAQAAAEAVGVGGLSAANMTPEAFSTIAFLMSLCIIWGIVLCTFTCRKYTSKLGTGTMSEEGESASSKAAKKAEGGKKGPSLRSFADRAMTAMFIGMVSAYIGSYVGKFASGSGKLSFSGDWLSL